MLFEIRMFFVTQAILYLIAFLILLRQGGVSSCSVRGGVVFMAREVTGALLRWCYKSQEERDTVLDHCLALLHHTLEASSMGECF